MKTSIHIIGILLIAISCSSQSKISEISCDEKLTPAINENWKYDSIAKYYLVNDSFIKNMNTIYRDCIKEKDSTYIVNKFGIRHSVHRYDANTYFIEYIINSPCSSRASNNQCITFTFFFDKQNKLQRWRKDESTIDIYK